MPPSLEVASMGVFGQLGIRGVYRAGRQAMGWSRLQAQLASDWLFGWFLRLSWDRWFSRVASDLLLLLNSR